MRTAPRTRTAVKAPSLISRDTVRGDTPRVAASWSIVSRGAMGVLCTYIGVYFALGCFLMPTTPAVLLAVASQMSGAAAWYRLWRVSPKNIALHRPSQQGRRLRGALLCCSLPTPSAASSHVPSSNQQRAGSPRFRRAACRSQGASNPLPLQHAMQRRKACCSRLRFRPCMSGSLQASIHRKASALSAVQQLPPRAPFLHRRSPLQKISPQALVRCAGGGRLQMHSPLPSEWVSQSAFRGQQPNLSFQRTRRSCASPCR